jgi:hypothetical protein
MVTWTTVLASDPPASTICSDGSLPAKSGALFGAPITITSNVDFPRDIIAADLDNDGLMDLCSASKNKIACYPNTADNGFAFGTENIVCTKHKEVRRLATGDLDGDGYPDLALASYKDNTIAWYRNTGKLGTQFSKEEIVVDSDCHAAISVVVADFDNDGHLDLAAASAGDNYVAWYRNTGDGKGTFTKRRYIIDPISYPISIVTGDFNGDGWLDLAAGSYIDDQWNWKENKGKNKATQEPYFNASPFKQHSDWAGIHLVVGNVNNSGCSDVVTASPEDSTVRWFPNKDKIGSFKSNNVITSSAKGVVDVNLGDLNGDGNQHDLIFADMFDNKISWVENMWDKSNIWDNSNQPKLISNNATGVFSTVILDVNGDGRNDIIAALSGSDEIVVYRNFGACCPPGYIEKEDNANVCIIKEINWAFWGPFTLTSSIMVLCCSFFLFVRRQKIQNTTQVNELNVSLLNSQTNLELAVEHVKNTHKHDHYLIASSDLHLLEKIAEGGGGFIYKANLGGTSTTVAAKEIKSGNMVEFQHEAQILTQMNHPQLLRLFGFCTKSAEDDNFHTDGKVHKYIVTEYAPNGSLENAIDAAAQINSIKLTTKSGTVQLPFTKTQALNWAIQIASGMHYLHSKGYVHRDIKPHNVLLNKSNDALVADLGFVRRPKENTNKNTQESKNMGRNHNSGGSNIDATAIAIKNDQAMTTMTGTPMYMAPEQITRDNYSYPVDVWAYGVTLVRLFTLKQPYNKNFHEDRIMGGIASGTMYPVKVKREDVPHEEVLRVINDCLQMKAKLRPNFKMIEERLVIALEKCTKGSINN